MYIFIHSFHTQVNIHVHIDTFTLTDTHGHIPSFAHTLTLICTYIDNSAHTRPHTISLLHFLSSAPALFFAHIPGGGLFHSAGRSRWTWVLGGPPLDLSWPTPARRRGWGPPWELHFGLDRPTPHSSLMCGHLGTVCGRLHPGSLLK